MASGSLTTLSPQPVLPHLLTPLQTLVHSPSGIGLPVPPPPTRDFTMAVILSLLFYIYINICTTGLWNPGFWLYRTELAARIFREQTYESSRCFLYDENVQSL